MRWFWELIYRRKAVELELSTRNSTVEFTVHMGDGTSLSARLGGETLKWCKANLKRPHGIEVEWEGGWAHKEHATVWFMDVKDALLFKMFWV